MVEPSHPGNIGGAARAMKTMGLSSLALVNPKRFPDPQADWRAAGALDLIEATQVYDTIQDSITDSVWVVGTSARSRHVPWPLLSCDEFAQNVVQKFADDDEISILFGREDNGLTNEELSLCNVHVRIPSHEQYGSLNLAMAVQIVAYELFKTKPNSAELGEMEWDKPWASHGEVESFVQHLESVMEKVGFSDPDESRSVEIRLRRLFARMQMDKTEVQILRGILTHIDNAIKHPN